MSHLCTICLCCAALVWGGCGGRAEETGDMTGEQQPARILNERPPGTDGPESSFLGDPASDCISGALGASLVRGLSPEGQAEAISLVALTDDHVVSLVVEQWGEPCGEEGAFSQCLLDLPGRQTGFYFAREETAHALLLSQGDTHTALGYWEVREFLGTIDTANEAAVLAWTEGWRVDCRDLRVHEGDYYFATSDRCADGAEFVRVGSDGVVSHSGHCSE